MLLPSSHVLSSSALDVNELPFSHGGSSDVYKGSYRGKQICVKRLRVAPSSGPEQATKGDTSRRCCSLIIGLLMVLTGALPRSFGVEAIGTSKHCPVHGCDYRRSPNYIGVDAWRGFEDLHQFISAHRPGRPRERTFWIFETYRLIFTSWSTSQTVLTTSTLAA